MDGKKGKFISFTVKAAVLFGAVAFICFFNCTAVKLIFQMSVLSAKSYLPQKGVSVSLTTSAENKEVSFSEALTQTTTETKKAVGTLSFLTEVDEDISEMIKTAQSSSADDKKDGDIIEQTFTDEGATDSFGDVRVKNVNKTQINIEAKLKEKLEFKVNKQEPAILIYHTHTTESYQLLDRDFYATGFLSRSDDEQSNMVRVGKAVKQEIERMGFKVIHDTAVYDNPYTGAYYRSMDGAQKYLEKYPSIRITLDIHRDAIQNDSGVKTKPTVTINGKKSAQIMIITGCQEEGNGITDLPEWEKNLTFALKLQQSMESLFKGLTRPVYFCPRSYNMGLTPMSLLIEIGTDANTLDEAVYAGKMLGRAIAGLLSEYT